MNFEFRRNTATLAIIILLVGCGAEPAQSDTPTDEVADKIYQNRQVDRTLREIPVSEMTDDQLRDRYTEDLKEMDRNAPTQEGLAAALRLGLEAKQLESVREFERRGDANQKARLERERIERDERSEENRVNNIRLDMEAAERERRNILNINQGLEAGQAESRARQEEDIRLLDENRRQALEKQR